MYIIPRGAKQTISSDSTVKHSELIMGDYDADMYVEGGDDALKWFNLSKDSDGWILDMTQASFGTEILFTHTIKQAEVDVTFRGIGLPDEFYTQVTKALPAD